jgi:hypothetical protein
VVLLILKIAEGITIGALTGCTAHLLGMRREHRASAQETRSTRER